jgi:hypothetical protein
VTVRRGGFRCLKSAVERQFSVPHTGQQEIERHLATGLSCFDINETALIASASRTAKWIAAHAKLKRAASQLLFLRFVYSVRHEISLSQLGVHQPRFVRLLPGSLPDSHFRALPWSRLRMG